MLKKILFILGLLINLSARADITGIYLGGGLGFGIQELNYSLVNHSTQNTTSNTPAMRTFMGYQFADWIGTELGYNYLTQNDNWDNLGRVSSTIYDLSFTPGFVIPGTDLSIYTRLGIDTISSNIDSGWYQQFFSNTKADFEWGIGLKFNILQSHTFIRAEYIDYGNATNNNNQYLSVNPSAIMINAAYVF